MSSGSSSPTTTTNITSNIPDYAQPYVMGNGTSSNPGLLPQAAALTNIANNPYQQYQGQTTAGFTPLQEQAMNNIAGMQVAPQVSQATGMTGLAGLQAGNIASTYNPGPIGYNQVQNQSLNNYQMGTPQMSTPQMGPAQQVQAQGLNTFQMNQPGNIYSQNFSGNAVNQYMSPYTQDVINAESNQAIQANSEQLPQLASVAAGNGDLGGSREALVQSQQNRALQASLQGIQATGLQNAYQNAQSQFNTSNAASLQAQQANQQTGLATGEQNLNAALGVQSLGAQQNLAAQEANQQAGLTVGQANLNAGLTAGQANLNAGLTAGQANLNALLGVQSLGAQQNLAAQEANQSAGLQAQSQALQSQQFGANLGLQGLQTQLSAANQLGQLGQEQYGQQSGIDTAQLGVGQTQQNLQQTQLNTDYQNFINQQNYPYAQLGYLSDILHGTATTASGSGVYANYQQAPNLAGQAAGLGIGAAGLAGLFGSAATG